MPDVQDATADVLVTEETFKPVGGGQAVTVKFLTGVQALLSDALQNARTYIA